MSPEPERRPGTVPRALPPLSTALVLAWLSGWLLDTPGLSLSHAVLATASGAVAVGLIVWTATSMNRVDETRRRFEVEVRRWRDVAASTQEAMVSITLEGLVTGWNPAAERIFGWPAAEIVGRPVSWMVPVERRGELAQNLARARRGEPLPWSETVRLHRDGSQIDVALSMSPLRDAEGRLCGASAIFRDIRERRAAEAIRREFERRHTELFEQASEGIFVADVDGRYTEVNGAGQRLLGYAAQEIVGKTIADFLAPEDAARLQAERAALLAGHERVSEWRMRARDGQWIPVEVSAKILADGRWQGIVRDLRAHKAAAAELARANAAERELRRQVEAMASATTKFMEAVPEAGARDLDALLRVVVQEARALTQARYAALGIGTDPGRPFEHWVYEGMTPEEVAAIGRRPRPVGLLGAVPRAGSAIRTDDIAASPDHIGFPPGHPRMRSFLGAPVGHAGRVLGHIYLTDRRGAEGFSADDQRALEFIAARAGTAFEAARLRREEALARSWLLAVIDGMPEVVLLVDAEGRISVNAAAQCFATADAGPGPPQRLDLRDPEGAPIAWSDMPLARALRGETSTAVELLARDRTGADVPVLASASPLRERGGAIIGAVCILRNITPLKEIEQLREQWTALVAHDLRQPLTVIAMSAQTLARSGASRSEDGAERSLTRIQSAALRLQRMIGDLLDASRIDARQLTLERRAVDLERLLAEVVARTEAGGAGRVRLQVAGPLPRVWADPDRVEQVMENLLSNAGKYGEPGTEVIVEARAEGGEVAVSTRNHGPDLTPDQIARLFTRFYRTRGAPAAKGLGLGLYITRGLIAAHGGRIWVESADRTTTFRFTLPVMQA